LKKHNKGSVYPGTKELHDWSN